MTTSKKIIVISYVCGIILTLTVIIGTFLGFDMTNVTTIATASWAEIGVSNAFYYNKAKKENTMKIYNSLSVEKQEGVDISSILNGG